eukprot:5824317-Prymnesium_polylepis.1
MSVYSYCEAAQTTQKCPHKPQADRLTSICRDRSTSLHSSHHRTSLSSRAGRTRNFLPDQPLFLRYTARRHSDSSLVVARVARVAQAVMEGAEAPLEAGVVAVGRAATVVARAA